MRKTLTLRITEDFRLYGMDEYNQVVLMPEDFRSTVQQIVNEGGLKDGDQFDIDIIKTGEPSRRAVDNTVAIHRTLRKFYPKDEVIEYMDKAVESFKQTGSYNPNEILK